MLSLGDSVSHVFLLFRGGALFLVGVVHVETASESLSQLIEMVDSASSIGNARVGTG
jgi:hypothetical protein